MTRQVTALFFLGRLALFAQSQTTNPRADAAPSFSLADMTRLVNDAAKASRANILSATQPLARQYSEAMQKAAKLPPTERAAAMQKATDDYKKRVDAFNQGGQPGADLSWAIALIRNAPHPENGFYRNLVDACMTGHKFLTRGEDGMPVLQQVAVEGGTTILHTSPPGLPVDKNSISQLSPDVLCPSLVKNAVRPSPPAPRASLACVRFPRTMQLCGAACATLTWRNGRFEVMARDGQLATIYTVESFTPDSIAMKRTELPHSGDYGLTAIYKGTITEGSDIAEGTVDFTWPGKPGYPHSAKWRASWGDSVAAARPLSQKKPEERGDAEQARGGAPATSRHNDSVSVFWVRWRPCWALAPISATGPSKAAIRQPECVNSRAASTIYPPDAGTIRRTARDGAERRATRAKT